MPSKPSAGIAGRNPTHRHLPATFPDLAAHSGLEASTSPSVYRTSAVYSVALHFGFWHTASLGTLTNLDGTAQHHLVPTGNATCQRKSS